MPRTQRYHNLTQAQMVQLARSLAQPYRRQTGAIGLIGPLGAGKTLLVKSLGAALGVRTISSPTFSIIRQYPYRNRLLYHIDLYRIRPAGLSALGLEDLLRQRPGLVVIEWLDRGRRLQKFMDLIVKIQPAANSARRHVTIRYQ